MSESEQYRSGFEAWARDLLDGDGENRAVRAFLMQYSCDRAVTVGAMLAHMNRSGWRGAAPIFALEVRPETHLTKAGAQIWIRYLFSLEGAAGALSDDAIPEQDQAHVLPPTRGTGSQQDAPRVVLLEHEIGGIMGEWQRTSNSRYELCRAVEAAVISRFRAAGRNTQANSSTDDAKDAALRLNWTEQTPPNKECSYDHVTAQTPFGRILITWKGWKDYPAPTVDEHPIDGFFYVGNDVEDAQREAERTYFAAIEAKAGSGT